MVLRERRGRQWGRFALGSRSPSEDDDDDSSGDAAKRNETAGDSREYGRVIRGIVACGLEMLEGETISIIVQYPQRIRVIVERGLGLFPRVVVCTEV